MARSEIRTRRYAEVQVGDRLPELDVELTRTLIVAGALASRDFQDVHHDAEAARAQGLPDVFMNILTTNGWVGRYVTDWAGPDAILKKVSIQLGAPNLPGDRMRLTGTVTATERIGGDGVVQLEVIGTNSYGHHVDATVSLSLPLEA